MVANRLHSRLFCEIGTDHQEDGYQFLRLLHIAVKLINMILQVHRSTLGLIVPHEVAGPQTHQPVGVVASGLLQRRMIQQLREQIPRGILEFSFDLNVLLYDMLGTECLMIATRQLCIKLVPARPLIGLRFHLGPQPVSYTHLRAHETDSYLVCRLLLEKKKTTKQYKY